MPDYLYRFRTVDKLLGDKYQELEKLEIYFSLPEELNDPMEGFNDISWFGDEVVWTNLLRNYLLCLERLCIRSMLVGDAAPIGAADIHVVETSDSETASAKDIFKDTLAAFLRHPSVVDWPRHFAARPQPIRRNELTFFLNLIHPHAVRVIVSVLGERGLIPNDAKTDEGLEQLSKILAMGTEILAKSNDGDDDRRESLYAAINDLQQQSRLRMKYNLAQTGGSPSRTFIMLDFPRYYLKALETLIYPPWSTACFVETADNATLWAHYAHGHSGVCLKFKTTAQGDASALTLNGVVGVRGALQADKSVKTEVVLGDMSPPFYKVAYQDRYPEIDFFRSLGRLSQGSLDLFWYRDALGNVSRCADGVVKGVSEWRTRYWQIFSNIVATKLTDWSYEREYRLVLSGDISMGGNDKQRRKLTYPFKSLDGIIFGIKTSDKSKLDIIKIIRAKCKKENRQDFHFYQASYSRKSGKIEIGEMPLLEVNQ